MRQVPLLMTPICPHGGRRWDSEKPFCDESACHRAWWLRYGLPLLLLIAAVITVGLLFPEFEIGNIGGYGYSGWAA